MIRFLLLAVVAGFASASAAQETAAAPAPDAFAPVAAVDADLEAFRFTKRPVVVFADTPSDPAFTEQMRLLEARWPELAERDVVVVTDTDPAAKTDVRQKLRPRGFMMVLIDKDGQVALRKPFPWDTRELTRTIDRMPDRREEMRNERSIEN